MMKAIDEDLLLADPWEEDDNVDMERCELCGEWYTPTMMSLDADGYCKLCVADTIGKTEALALKWLNNDEYKIFQRIYGGIAEDVS